MKNDIGKIKEISMPGCLLKGWCLSYIELAQRRTATRTQVAIALGWWPLKGRGHCLLNPWMMNWMLRLHYIPPLTLLSDKSNASIGWTVRDWSINGQNVYGQRCQFEPKYLLGYHVHHSNLFWRWTSKYCQHHTAWYWTLSYSLEKLWNTQTVSKPAADVVLSSLGVIEGKSTPC